MKTNRWKCNADSNHRGRVDIDGQIHCSAAIRGNQYYCLWLDQLLLRLLNSNGARVANDGRIDCNPIDTFIDLTMASSCRMHCLIFLASLSLHWYIFWPISTSCSFLTRSLASTQVSFLLCLAVAVSVLLSTFALYSSVRQSISHETLDTLQFCLVAWEHSSSMPWFSLRISELFPWANSYKRQTCRHLVRPVSKTDALMLLVPYCC